MHIGSKTSKLGHVSKTHLQIIKTQNLYRLLTPGTLSYRRAILIRYVNNKPMPLDTKTTWSRNTIFLINKDNFLPVIGEYLIQFTKLY